MLDAAGLGSRRGNDAIVNLPASSLDLPIVVVNLLDEPRDLVESRFGKSTSMRQSPGFADLPENFTMRLLPLLALPIFLLAACASPPARVDGPSAIVADTASGGGMMGGQFFVVTRIDAERVANARTASGQASYGRGVDLQVRSYRRQVAAGRRHLELMGSVGFAAPIQEIVSAARGNLLQVGGGVDVELVDGHRYRVDGVLDELRREVWIEDEDSHARLASVVAPVSEAARQAAAAPARFACCNLRHNDDFDIGDATEVERPFVPAGTPVRVYEVKVDTARAAFDGKPMRLVIDEGKPFHSMRQFVDQVTVADDPAQALATWPAAVQRAVRAGQVALGMTRAQALMAIGYPRTDYTPDIAANAWRYGTRQDDQTLTLYWGADGRIDRIDAPGNLRARLVAAE